MFGGERGAMHPDAGMARDVASCCSVTTLKVAVLFCAIVQIKNRLECRIDPQDGGAVMAAAGGGRGGGGGGGGVGGDGGGGGGGRGWGGRGEARLLVHAEGELLSAKGPVGAELPCPFCGFVSHGINSRQNLHNHLLTHTGEKPFQCPVCPMRCLKKSNLKRHMLRHHPGPAAGPSPAHAPSAYAPPGPAHAHTHTHAPSDFPSTN
ncbi:zinc finger protein 513-like [Penaeus japonicus]|uniref:zinc finger protein 513-like n=1 Tax=Penaeus japonicus TaxID=27405 RepID=UPI001C70E0DD|nr:zinc finger protein 513-like [Penaeus japonicus]